MPTLEQGVAFWANHAGEQATSSATQEKHKVEFKLARHLIAVSAKSVEEKRGNTRPLMTAST
jgi:hypothetical protein